MSPGRGGGATARTRTVPTPPPGPGPRAGEGRPGGRDRGGPWTRSRGGDSRTSSPPSPRWPGTPSSSRWTRRWTALAGVGHGAVPGPDAGALRRARRPAAGLPGRALTGTNGGTDLTSRMIDALLTGGAAHRHHQPAPAAGRRARSTWATGRSPQRYVEAYREGRAPRRAGRREPGDRPALASSRC
ncbi:hypothetical protein HBB16_17320 [Pseudonocardia sp. MCCB 268]|nr:hypothetical protein [Pseudonocardia cytotoxica]